MYYSYSEVKTLTLNILCVDHAQKECTFWSFSQTRCLSFFSADQVVLIPLTKKRNINKSRPVL